MNLVRNLQYDEIPEIIYSSNICRLNSGCDSKVSVITAPDSEPALPVKSHGKTLFMIKRNPLTAVEFEYLYDDFMDTSMTKGIVKNMIFLQSIKYSASVRILHIIGKCFNL